jgi:hypothetical protein
MCNFKVLNKIFRNERMAIGIRLNGYKCKVERKMLLNAYSFLDVNGTVTSVKQNYCMRPQNKTWCSFVFRM